MKTTIFAMSLTVVAAIGSRPLMDELAARLPAGTLEIGLGCALVLVFGWAVTRPAVYHTELVLLRERRTLRRDA